MMTRFSALPLAVLERLAEGVLDPAEAERRQPNIGEVVATARQFDEDERRSIALDILGREASEQEIAKFAEQLRMPPELVAVSDPRWRTRPACSSVLPRLPKPQPH